MTAMGFIVAGSFLAIGWWNGYHDKGAHLKQQTWDAGRQIATLAAEQERVAPSTLDNENRFSAAKAAFARFHAKAILQLRKDLDSHGWATDGYWNDPQTYNPSSFADLKRTAQYLQNTAFHMK
jgi:hypothetical protein